MIDFKAIGLISFCNKYIPLINEYKEWQFFLTICIKYELKSTIILDYVGVYNDDFNIYISLKTYEEKYEFFNQLTELTFPKHLNPYGK